MPDNRPIDGVSLIPMLEGRTFMRDKPIPYRFLGQEVSMYGSPTLALTDGRWKLVTNLSRTGEEDMLFDLEDDRGEGTNIVSDHPERVTGMREQLTAFVDSCRVSHHGGDYQVSCTPMDEFQEPGGWASDEQWEASTAALP